MNPPQVPSPLRIWQLVLGFTNTAVLYTLTKAGVIEQLRDHPKTPTELAERCHLNPDVLHRALRYATVIGVVGHDDGQYALTEVGRFLLKDVPGSLYLGILLFGSESWQRAWQNLGHSLATGDEAFELATGLPFFEYLDNQPELGTTFDQFMTVATTGTARAIAGVYDFTSFRSVCDIGGGQGILLKYILMANPHLRGILYDQESVVKDHVLADLSDRVEIQSGNFFDRVPAADVLLIKTVLHDWSDEKCQIILSHCRQAMQPTSRLLVIDRVIATPTDFIDSFFDLHMQVMQGGRERTENEFSSLLQSVGMKLNKIIPTKAPQKIIEASLIEGAG
ncbi:MAG: hypothetical protein M1570_08705 [Chloroflexi bacterium]|nr:hypothetical protein [Chloroflexota bacterium]